MGRLKPQVVVLSRNYSTGIGVIRSLGAAGYTVDLMASCKQKGSSAIPAASKYVRHAMEVLSPDIRHDNGDAMIKALLAYVKKYGLQENNKAVLFPTDDFTTSVVDKNRAVLEEYFFMPYVEREKHTSITEYMDKAVQAKLAKEAGLATPKEWIFSLNGHVDIPKDIVYPCFVKPMQSRLGFKHEMAVCEDEPALVSHLVKMKKDYADRDVLIQEFLNIQTEYDLSGICLGNRVLIPGVLKKTGISKHELGVTMSGQMKPPSVLGEVQKTITCMLEKLGYFGMFDMELNLADGKLYFGEINFRSGGPNFAYFLSGVNLPELFLKGLFKEPVDDAEAAISIFDKTFVYEKVAWEDFIYSHISYRELQQCLKENDHTLLTWEEDPKPGEVFYKRIRLSCLKHRVYRAIGKEKKTENAALVQKPTAMVIGKNYSNILAITRDLGEAGYDVRVIRINNRHISKINLLSRMKPDSCSKYVSSFRECTPEEGQHLAEILMKQDVPKNTVLLAVDDYSAFETDLKYDMLSRKYLLADIGKAQGEICKYMDKAIQKELAKGCGLPVPGGGMVTVKDGKATIPESVTYPCFVKPAKSVGGKKSSMRKCDSAQELQDFLEKQQDGEFLAEEYLRIKTEYSLLGAAANDIVCAPYFFKAVESGHRERTGVTMVGEKVAQETYRDLIDRTVELLRKIGYTGLFDVDFIMTEEGKMYFTEINFRAGASMRCATKDGTNITGMYADAVRTKNPDCLAVAYASQPTDLPERFLSEKILMEEYARSDLNYQQVKDRLKKADVFLIKDDKDEKPYRYFKRYYAVAAVMRLPYRLRDRMKKK